MSHEPFAVGKLYHASVPLSGVKHTSFAGRLQADKDFVEIPVGAVLVPLGPGFGNLVEFIFGDGKIWIYKNAWPYIRSGKYPRAEIKNND